MPNQVSRVTKKDRCGELACSDREALADQNFGSAFSCLLKASSAGNNRWACL